MKGIFISYRREDAAGYAGRLYDRLAAHFGADRVFMDVEGIEPGVDFVEALERAVGSCEVLIVIIGKDWLAAGSAGKRRLDDPADFVRIETAAALARNIRVVPVLVDDAEMPRADQLPKDLAPLARRQAVELSHKQWDATSAELIHTLEKILNAGKQRVAETAPPESEPSSASPPEARSGAGSPAPVTGSPSHRRYWGIGAVLAVLAAGAALFLTQPWSRFTRPSPRPAHLVVAPERLEFPEQALRAAGLAGMVTLTNDGGAPLRVSALKLEGSAGADFALSDDQCSGRTLAPAATCSVKVWFSAQVAGMRSATLAFATEPPSPVLLAMQGRGLAPALAEVARAAEKPVEPVPPRTAEPVPPRTAEPAPPRPAEPVAPRQVAPPQPKPEVPAPPKILHFEASVANDTVRLCYGVQNAASATITPSPGEVKPLAKDCVPVAAGRTYTLTARNAAGTAVTRTITVEAAASPAPVPLATPSALPRVGDTWVYRFQSRWKNVEQRFYTHQVTAVSEREVRETLSYTPSADKTSESKTFAPETRFVEWRGKGYYFVEFNPFLQAFGALQPGTTWKPLSIPVEDPFFGGWYTTGRAIDWDSVTVPAGAFKAIRVEINSSRKSTGSRAMAEQEPVRILQVIWYAPDVKRAVKLVRTVSSASGLRLDEDTYELVKFRVQ
jgi:hypothetical protein